MNITRKLVLAGLAIAAAVACQPTAKELKMETFEQSDGTEHAHLSMHVELPAPVKGPAGHIRTKILEVMDAQLTHIASFEDEPGLFPAYEGNPLDTKAVMNYYWDHALEAFGGAAQEDYDERVASVEENDGLTDEEREFALNSMPKFEYDFSLVKTDETDRYVVFVNEDYVYLGGAHGGVTGQGPLTFDKKTGDLVEKFLEPGCLKDIQPLLRKGLAGYFADNGEEIEPENVDEYLMTDNGVIPFPAWATFPTENGLGFLYQQYEIAPYAVGMPGFMIPYDDILPYLTAEAKALLGK
jgi:hypothetical protein